MITGFLVCDGVTVNGGTRPTNPYIVHPQAVMELVRSVPHTEEMLAAAWLHDTVEDTPTTLGDIDSHFGPKVAELVRMLTNVSHAEDGNRFERKNRDRRHSAAASPQAKTIKLADLIDNTRSLLDYDSHFAQTYLIEKQRLLEVLTEGDPTLWRQASHIVEQGLLRLQQQPHNVPASWFEHARRRYRESDAA
ncbi:bifunctional (p)ppGpp synthetase/guanosine-3',5'-bis(diphosphate) 3'-pyrophosphohydrolase [Serratia marcescens]|nr:HD domain-containing protein [Serratia marcescens]MBH2635448.1 bifunctional (p)ppGpp synthetase/guanosine-3',5'-bis(diphosphate) 3'-pyrophosphohydrolase [Serratia marcescens]NSM52248.1 HD domain-containing protein [Serratia marcescens]HAT3691477.1 bifunctional (p)ppGpp synthetase/guanosine-3',5'-bis(diphosphate) 3'-pyrophosphohydrolase [Serratia marcescens]